jgi:hypothetical protein
MNVELYGKVKKLVLDYESTTTNVKNYDTFKSELLLLILQELIKDTVRYTA